MQVTNNFFNNQEFFKIQKTILGDTFPWFIKSPGVFFHHLYDKEQNKLSPFIYILDSLNKNLKVSTLIDAQILMTLKTDKAVESKVNNSTDIYDKSMKSILFFNTSNASINISGLKIIKCEENRLITLPTNMAHFGTTQTDEPINMVLTINYML
tara:strand:+ start:238 stop:699 length:462 start_codon:yes stop_codon:yes gene_type:complete